MSVGSGPKRAASESGTCPAGIADAPGALPDGARAGADAEGGGLTTPPPGGARLIAGGGGTEGMGAGGTGGPKMELPHCAEADCGIQSA